MEMYVALQKNSKWVQERVYELCKNMNSGLCTSKSLPYVYKVCICASLFIYPTTMNK
jgi:hypothetical protein